MGDMSAKAQACVVHCMDLRIQKTVDELFRSLGLQLGEFDRLSIAGGASPHLSPFNNTMGSLELSGRLHSPDTLILTAHEDCGAGTTLEDLQRVLADVRKTFPGKSASAFWVKLNGSWEAVS